MPTVRIGDITDGDADLEARLIREVAAVVADVLQKPVGDVRVTVDESPVARPEYAWISAIDCPAEAYDRYSEFRANEIQPALERTPGYVDAMMFRSREDPTKFVSITRWLSESLNTTYRRSPTHDQLRAKSIGFTGIGNRGQAYDIVHGDRD